MADFDDFMPDIPVNRDDQDKISTGNGPLSAGSTENDDKQFHYVRANASGDEINRSNTDFADIARQVLRDKNNNMTSDEIANDLLSQPTLSGLIPNNSAEQKLTADYLAKQSREELELNIEMLVGKPGSNSSHSNVTKSSGMLTSVAHDDLDDIPASFFSANHMRDEYTAIMQQKGMADTQIEKNLSDMFKQAEYHGMKPRATRADGTIVNANATEVSIEAENIDPMWKEDAILKNALRQARMTTVKDTNPKKPQASVKDAQSNDSAPTKGPSLLGLAGYGGTGKPAGDSNTSKGPSLLGLGGYGGTGKSSGDSMPTKGPSMLMSTGSGHETNPSKNHVTSNGASMLMSGSYSFAPVPPEKSDIKAKLRTSPVTPGGSSMLVSTSHAPTAIMPKKNVFDKPETYHQSPLEKLGDFFTPQASLVQMAQPKPSTNR